MAEERVDRRLAAIFAGDIAGYSRLMGVDEERTLRQLKAHRKELVDPKITEHRGRIVKTTGDGMLVEFVSVADAVRCVVDIQRGMLQRNADVPVSRGSLSRNASGIVASVSADTTATVPGMPMRSPMNPAAGGEAAAAPIVIV
jgi:class 3 adenylate cyclase